MFGKILLQELRNKNISIRKIAAATGIDHLYLAKIITGKRHPPEEKTILKIAKILNVSPNKLIISSRRIPQEYLEKASSDEFIEYIEKFFQKPSIVNYNFIQPKIEDELL